MRNDNLRYMVTAAALAGVILVATAFLLHIPIGTVGGYIHLGDAIVYLAACLLPTPYAMLAAAVGCGLADLLSGAAVWVIPTVIVKSLMVMLFTCRNPRILCRHNLLAAVVAGLIGITGYYLAEMLIVSSFVAPLASVLPNAIQGVGSAVAFMALGALTDRTGWAARILQNR